MKVLVTGATGKVGPYVCRRLRKAGHEVRATDKEERQDIGMPVVLTDLLDMTATRRLVAGAEAVVHLGNHSGPHVLPDAQRVFSENTTINTNTFYAAQQAGVERLVFASSIQVVAGDRMSGPKDRGVEKYYPDVPLNKPVDRISSLIDASRAEEETGWTPRDN